jgi:CDP-glucose 4,6-dehydratase
MINNKSFWKGKKVFITGHTGFKGSWLCLILNQLGSVVAGYSLPPKKNSLFHIINLKNKIKNNYYSDIRNFKILKKEIDLFKPDIIFHLAAQSLVIDSYFKPFETFEINALGNLNIMEAVKNLNYKGALIVVTTDKVYKIKKNNKKKLNENDELGVTDPYGSSKVCSEIITSSYINSFLSSKNYFKAAIARSGNVIGGGDFSKYRIIPDFYTAYKLKKKLIIRNPEYVRPWQFVLEPLIGYINLAEKVYLNKIKCSDKLAWNFGPSRNDCISVKELIKILLIKSQNRPEIFTTKKKSGFSETKYLFLSNNKSKKFLGWRNIYNVNSTLDKIVEWYEAPKNKKIKICNDQIFEYLTKIKNNKLNLYKN